ncbi:hypothetical protein [Tropicimonas marinistellae]|uniref:hypothetical protein n=1 Tax=Tropicimonas marinistellae TaxID=1739787 RepID=UPI000833D793|nr:hypothetical protein [Tropicimonas marinistellae]
MAALLKKFDTDNARLVHLFATDTYFRDLCEDYGAALASLQAWLGRPDFAHQFRCMADEVEMEVEGILRTPTHK